MYRVTVTFYLEVLHVRNRKQNANLHQGSVGYFSVHGRSFVEAAVLFRLVSADDSK